MGRKWIEKHHYGYLKRQTKKIAHEITWTWLRGGNLKRETGSLLWASQNNAIITILFSFGFMAYRYVQVI